MSDQPPVDPDHFVINTNSPIAVAADKRRTSRAAIWATIIVLGLSVLPIGLRFAKFASRANRDNMRNSDRIVERVRAGTATETEAQEIGINVETYRKFQQKLNAKSQPPMDSPDSSEDF